MEQHQHHLNPGQNARSPTPIAEELDDDDDSSSAYGPTIRRIMERSRANPGLSLNIPDRDRANSAPIASSSYDSLPRHQPAVEMVQLVGGPTSWQLQFATGSANHPRLATANQLDIEERSLYSINETEMTLNENSSLRLPHLEAFSSSALGNHRPETTSLTTFENDLSSADHQPFDFSTHSNDFNKPPAFARRYFASHASNTNTNNNNNQQPPPPPPQPQLHKRQQHLHRNNSISQLDTQSCNLNMSGNYYQDNNHFTSNNNNSYGNYHNERQHRLGSGAGGGEFSESNEPDLNTKWSWKNLKREFKLSHSESLFHLYQAKLQHSFFVASLILNIIFNLGAVISYAISKYHEMNIYLILMRLASITVFCLFLILIWFNKLWMQSKFSRTVASLAVLTAMIFGELSGAICALVNDQTTPLASIRRTYYLIITNHVFLPFPTRIQSCAATIVITSFEIVVTYISRRDNNCRADYLTLYSIADIIFYASSAMIGFQITFLLEIAIRRTFLNHKYCIQSTYKLNYEKEQQEQLLRSCFPQHLIEQIRDEIRDSIARISKRQSQPFKPFYNLYVEKYENVTILYADIVNSMNLTDKLNPAELVETLNELYGRFDELAEKYSCLRIKLLGDCYYCVSGLPEYDEDHAMKCLLMGLGMIKIIQSIRESRNVDIDMRIGIHSGSVLSGLLGLRKWQFDIWSFDAMKASQMEHSGQPGFVHITQETLDLISKDHARRQDLIITATRQSDDTETTYLISERVSLRHAKDGPGAQSPLVGRMGQSEKLKAYIEKLRVRPTASAMDFTQRRMALESSLKKYREIHEKVDETMKRAIADMPLGSAWKQFFFIDCIAIDGLLGLRSRGQRRPPARERPSPRRAARTGARTGIKFSSQCGGGGGAAKRRPAPGRARRPRDPPAAGPKRPTVRSPSNKAILQTDPLFHLYLICVGLITLSILAIKCLIPGMPIYTHTVIGFAFLLAIILASFVYTQVKSKKINLPFRILLWLIISASLTMLQLVDLIVPDELDSLNVGSIADISRADSLSCAFAWVSFDRCSGAERQLAATEPDPGSCSTPDRLTSEWPPTTIVDVATSSQQYYTFTIIVAMTATSIFIRINVWLKFLIHLSTIIFYVVINNPPATMMDTLKEFLQTQSNNWSLLDHKSELSHLFYICMIAVILHLIDRQVEYILSLNIQWNEQLESDRVESQTVGEINRILLENILPPHVLKRYLYNTTVSYDQLYHESHPSCAVMFASIPNYESFYTENNLNEQGLKCLQLLNEIICDFDQLLSHPAFRNIEKIKTIGSTYMAACFDVTRRTSDCTIDGQQALELAAHTPELGLKTGWVNAAMVSGDQHHHNHNHNHHSQQLSTPASPHISPKSSTGAPNCDQAGRRRAASGSTLCVDDVAISNVVTMVCFATALMENLARINRDAWQDFRLRIGIAIGPVIAGVVGASKPTYDIWGDTVNVASRLESSGVLGRIQVSEQVAQILAGHGQFDVECRGPIEVKGKGRLTTYLVVTPYDSVEHQHSDSLESEPDGLAADLDEPPEMLETAHDDKVEELCADSSPGLYLGS